MCRTAEASSGSWLCQILVAKLKNVVEDIFILQILPACQDTLVMMSCRETGAGSKESWAECRWGWPVYGGKERRRLKEM